MKKTLSIILSLALLLGVLVVIPAFSASADTVEFSDYAFNKTIFDSSKYNLADSDKNNQINPATNKFWLDGGAWIGGSRKDGLFIAPNKYTSSILEYNDVSNTDVTNFEWQFDLSSGHDLSAEKAFMTFYFHVGENSTISTTPTSSKNVLGISLCGSNYSGNCQRPLSLVPLYTTSNGVRPIDYDYASGVSTPKEGYFLDLTGFNNDVSDTKNTFKSITINIKLVGRELTITVWETANKSHITSLTVKIPRKAFNDYTPSGDFVVSNNNGSGGNMFLTNMSVKSGNYESGKASNDNYDWWETNTIYEKDESTGLWNTVERGAGYISNADAIQLNQNGVADRLLANNGYLPEGGVENFVWGFDYTPGRTWASKTSFAFHIDDTSITNGVATMDGDTVTDYVRPYLSRKNMIAVTFCSANTNKSSIELTDGIVIQQSDENGNMTALETESGYITKGALAYPEKAAEELSSVNANETTGAVFYSVRIVYYEGNVTVYMWKRGDASTMFAVSAEIDESLVPAAGDFSIINFSNYAYLDNMFITSLDGLSDAEAAVAHYEDTYEEITGKALCAHDYDGVTDVDATYFVAGSKDLKCACGDTLVTGIEVPATDIALNKNEAKYDADKNELTITLEYSDGLILDVAKGAEISFNYSIAGYDGTILIENDETGATITLQGFNAERLNSKLEYYLSAEYGTNPTGKLETATKGSIDFAEEIKEDTAIGEFMNALKNNEDTVVSGTIASTDEFATNTITADIKAGTMILNFVASSELVEKLAENKADGLTNRKNTITVTIEGLEPVVFEMEKMTQSTIVSISGMSFEQLYGKVTIEVDFEYPDNENANINAVLEFDGSAAVEQTESAVATAFKDYMTR